MADTNKPPSFFASEETVTVDLEPGYWVEIKKELDYGEESELEGAAIKAGIDPAGKPSMEYSLKQLRSLKLSLYIVDWNLVGPTGKSVPLPPTVARRTELFNRLRPAWARKIDGWIDRIRAEQGAIDTLSLVGLDDAKENPTVPGETTETAPPSSSANGGVSPIEISSARPIVSSAGPSL